MSLAENTLTAAFPEFVVKTTKRPDGGLLFTLHVGEREVMRRAISAGQTKSSVELEWVINSIRRDLALEAGVSPAISHLQSQSRTALPTYEYL